MSKRVLRIVLLALVLAIGVAVGVIWHGPLSRVVLPGGEGAVAAAQAGQTKHYWTCGMHPQVHQDHPGTCPICHMKLVPMRMPASAAAPANTAGQTSGDAATGPVGNAQAGGERNIKYWWDPMLGPSSITDKPGKSAMGMDLVPVCEDEHADTGRAVIVDPVIVQNMGVRTEVAVEGRVSRTVRMAATLAEPEPAQVDINLRVSGWIRTLYAGTEGMAVRKEDPLFDLYSPELGQAIEELIAARRNAGAAVSEGLPLAVGQEAATRGDPLAQQTSRSFVSAAEARLASLGLTPEQIRELGAMEHAPAAVMFLSPIDGYVKDKAGIYQGSAVMPGQRVMRLADRSVLWADGRAPEGSVGAIRVGQEAVVRADLTGSGEFRGTVSFIDPHIDPVTRTATVRVEVPNPDLRLREGMYGTVSVATEPGPAAAVVPREAVIDSGETQRVFVDLGGGRFEPRSVTVGESGDGGRIQVLSGLRPGERVVVSGQFLLDSESRLQESIRMFMDEKGGARAAAGVPAAGTVEPADAGRPLTAIDRVVDAYLGLSARLGGPQKDTGTIDPAGLVAAIRELDAGALGPEAGAAAADAAKSASALRDQPLEKQRELFIPLSKAVLRLTDAAAVSPEFARTLYVVNCPMLQADWIQRGQKIANPFYGDEMKECGEVARPLGEKGAGQP